MVRFYQKSLFAVCALALATLDARAASIEVKKQAGYPFAMIRVEGEILFGDEKQFVTAALEPTEAAVILNSPGGNIYAATEIGKAIRLKGFDTLVTAGSECASACALAWLGGKVRFMEAGAKIGFHAASIAGQQTANSVANAVVGAYLNQLGLTMSAVRYMTAAQPNEIRWLSFADAQLIGLDVKPFGEPHEQAVVRVPEPIPASPAVIRPPALVQPSEFADNWADYGEWIQAASRDSQADATQLAMDIAGRAKNTFVFTSDTGWFVVALGPYKTGTAAADLSRLLTTAVLPYDSMVKTGAHYAKLVWGRRPERVNVGAVPADTIAVPNDQAPFAAALTAAREFFTQSSLPASKAIEYLDRVYSPTIRYFGKAMPKADVMADKVTFLERWPERLYTIDPNGFSAACSNDGFCEATGLIKWRAYSAERDATSVGSATFSLTFELRGTMSVVSESSEVLTRSIYKGH